MTTRTLVLALVIGSLSTSIWAQVNSCTQYRPWELSGGAGCQTPPPSAGWVASEEYNQATYGGAGPSCTYTPNPYTGAAGMESATRFIPVWARGTCPHLGQL
jgi:hypothetical protein